MTEALLERLSNPEAVLSRGDLRALGLPRRAYDAVFRALPNVKIPGYAFTFVRVADYLRFMEENTYRGDRVRPTR
jgi:hypothetical protein